MSKNCIFNSIRILTNSELSNVKCNAWSRQPESTVKMKLSSGLIVFTWLSNIRLANYFPFPLLISPLLIISLACQYIHIFIITRIICVQKRQFLNSFRIVEFLFYCQSQSCGFNICITCLPGVSKIIQFSDINCP